MNDDHDNAQTDREMTERFATSRGSSLIAQLVTARLVITQTYADDRMTYHYHGKCFRALGGVEAIMQLDRTCNVKGETTFIARTMEDFLEDHSVAWCEHCTGWIEPTPESMGVGR